MTSEEQFGGSTGFLLHRLGVGAERVIERTLKPLGLRGRELRVLGFLDAEGRSQRELAAVSGLDRTTMVAVVDRLEELGLVERRRNASDRRKQLVVPTEAGNARLAEASVELARAESEFLAPLTASQRQALNSVLKDLFAARRVDC